MYYLVEFVVHFCLWLDVDSAVKAFADLHDADPFRLENMDLYSNLLYVKVMNPKCCALDTDDNQFIVYFLFLLHQSRYMAQMLCLKTHNEQWEILLLILPLLTFLQVFLHAPCCQCSSIFPPRLSVNSEWSVDIFLEFLVTNGPMNKDCPIWYLSNTSSTNHGCYCSYTIKTLDSVIHFWTTEKYIYFSMFVCFWCLRTLTKDFWLQFA